MSVPTIVRAASVVYVLAWLTGLFAAPSVPADGAGAAVRQHYLDHGGASVVQSLLVHGVAGVALVVLASALSRLITRLSGPVVTLGLAAGLLSLAQVGVLLSLVRGADAMTAADVVQRVGWIESLDVVKLATLAGFTVVASLAAVGSHSAPRWLVPCSGVLALLLVAGAASFVVSSPPLTAALFTSLPLLLLWAGAVGLTVGRRTSSHSAPAHASVR